MSHKYKVRIDASDYETIRFLASRGYCVAMYEALVHEDTLCEAIDDYLESCDYYIPEHLMWAVCDELNDNGGHGFGPVQPELEAKLFALVEQVV